MSFEGVFAKVRADIDRVGWSAIGVFPTVDEPNVVSYTYTIGLLESYEHPELIVFGVSYEQGHGLLHSAVEEIKLGLVFEPGKRYPKVLEGYDVEARAMNAEGRPLNVARAFYDRDIEALQLLWPDVDGLFPGEDGVDPLTAIYQVVVID